ENWHIRAVLRQTFGNVRRVFLLEIPDLAQKFEVQSFRTPVGHLRTGACSIANPPRDYPAQAKQAGQTQPHHGIGSREPQMERAGARAIHYPSIAADGICDHRFHFGFVAQLRKRQSDPVFR
ncbi:MAG TPA: hypothetical protein VIU14_01670, partial [Mesorhizobium sp.]